MTDPAADHRGVGIRVLDFVLAYAVTIAAAELTLPAARGVVPLRPPYGSDRGLPRRGAPVRLVPVLSLASA